MAIPIVDCRKACGGLRCGSVSYMNTQSVELNGTLNVLECGSEIVKGEYDELVVIDLDITDFDHFEQLLCRESLVIPWDLNEVPSVMLAVFRRDREK